MFNKLSGNAPFGFLYVRLFQCKTLFGNEKKVIKDPVALASSQNAMQWQLHINAALCIHRSLKICNEQCCMRCIDASVTGALTRVKWTWVCTWLGLNLLIENIFNLKSLIKVGVVIEYGIIFYGFEFTEIRFLFFHSDWKLINPPTSGHWLHCLLYTKESKTWLS